MNHYTRGPAGRVDSPRSGWEIDLSGCACASRASNDAINRATATAAEILWRATCQRFPGTFRCAARRFGPSTRLVDLSRAYWYPIVSVEAVVEVDGDGPEPWDADEWRFDPPGLLVAHGDWAFNAQHRLDRPDGFGSWWVEATIGVDPPADVLAAAGQLACELLKAIYEPDACNLPDNVQSITRNGSTITFDRAQWAGVPLMQQVTQPWPVGWGCAAADSVVMRDPAARESWVETALLGGS